MGWRREKSASELKPSRHGYLTVSFDPEIVAGLDAVTADISARLGFRISRSQAVKHLLRIYEQHKEKV